MDKLTHFDKNGNAVMVDVSEKKENERIATACSTISMSKETLDCIKNGEVGKGDVLGVARVAGIMAAKKTSDLIPMCHPLMITKCNIDYEIDEVESKIKILATVKLVGKTGVEMEALTAATVTALTIYDMCKAMDKRMVIGKIKILATVKLVGKTGVEMEALTAATVTALTIYDMCKAMDKRMVIENTFLLKKTGGKSGEFNF